MNRYMCKEYAHVVFLFWLCFSSVNSFRALGSGQRAGGPEGGQLTSESGLSHRRPGASAAASSPSVWFSALQRAPTGSVGGSVFA